MHRLKNKEFNKKSIKNVKDKINRIKKDYNKLKSKHKMLEGLRNKPKKE